MIIEMLNLLLIASCLLFGLYQQRNAEFKKFAPSLFNQSIFNFFLPVIILAYVPNLGAHFSLKAVILPASMPWLTFALSVVMISALRRTFHWDKATAGALILVSGLGNTSFVGFPLLEAFFGAPALTTGIVIDQLGSFMVFSTVATIFASRYSHESLTASQLFKRLFFFPPFVATLVSFTLMPFAPFEALTPVLMKIGAPMIPLAIISLGLQIPTDAKKLKSHWKEVSVVLFLKLFLLPAIVFAAYVFGLKQRGAPVRITIVEAAMGPMFSSAILATRFHLKPELASLIVIVGVLVSLITVPLWVLLTHWV